MSNSKPKSLKKIKNLPLQRKSNSIENCKNKKKKSSSNIWKNKFSDMKDFLPRKEITLKISKTPFCNKFNKKILNFSMDSKAYIELKIQLKETLKERVKGKLNLESKREWKFIKKQ